MKCNRQVCAAVLALVAAGCAMRSPIVRQQCYNADAQLAALLTPLEAARATGCALDPRGGESECARLEREIARQAIVCPVHEPTLMANAVIAYDEHRADVSQQYLDQILSEPRSYPDAAALRGQIAIEQGNLPYAIKMLEQQIALAPAHAGLHETHAAALYVAGMLAGARTELALAERLGAPPWRVAYHLGLIEEASGRPDEAVRRYTESLSGNAGFAPATERLKALQARAPAPARP
jgi:predicted Zn-dependent protease